MYGIILTLMWGLFFMDINRPGKYGYLFVLLITFYSPYFINRVFPPNNKLLLIRYLFPVLYTIAAYIAFDISSLSFRSLQYVFSTPFLFALLLAFMGERLKDLKMISLQYLALVIVIFYCLSISNYFERHRGYSFSENRSIKESVIDVSKFKEKNIYDYKFTSNDIELSLPKNGKYVVLESWSYNCPPCIKALKANLKATLESDDTDFYYVHTNLNSRNGNQKTPFISYRDESDVLLDHFNGYSTPQFFIFNPSGKLIFKHIGYSDRNKEDLLNSIKQSIIHNQ